MNQTTHTNTPTENGPEPSALAGDAGSEAFTDQASFIAAVAQVQEAEVAYRLDQPLMPDSAFDALKDRVAATKDAHPGWDDEGVTTQVASGASVGGDVRHSSPMLSLAKATTAEEVRAFIAGLSSDGHGGEQAPGPLVVEVKMDGCAISARYENGALVLAAQRGDGISGEDITSQITRGAGVAGLPARLTTSAGKNWSGEVRGEVYMSEADFDAANELRVGAGRPAFANPRNAVSGSLRNIDRTYDVPMSFAAYDLLPGQDGSGSDGGDELATYSQSLDTAQALGFATARQLLPQNLRAPHEGVEDVLAAIEQIEALRPALGFPIDGSLESRLLR